MLCLLLLVCWLSGLLLTSARRRGTSRCVISRSNDVGHLRIHSYLVIKSDNVEVQVCTSFQTILQYVLYLMEGGLIPAFQRVWNVLIRRSESTFRHHNRSSSSGVCLVQPEHAGPGCRGWGQVLHRWACVSMQVLLRYWLPRWYTSLADVWIKEWTFKLLSKTAFLPNSKISYKL